MTVDRVFDSPTFVDNCKLHKLEDKLGISVTFRYEACINLMIAESSSRELNQSFKFNRVCHSESKLEIGTH